MSAVAITATIVDRWHEIVMVYALCSVIFLVDRLILNFYLHAAVYTWNNASVRASLSWNQGIPTMVATIPIRMGGTIVSWFG